METKRISSGYYEITLTCDGVSTTYTVSRINKVWHVSVEGDTIGKFERLYLALNFLNPQQEYQYKIKHLGGILDGIEQTVTTDVEYEVGKVYKKAITSGSYKVLERVR